VPSTEKFITPSLNNPKQRILRELKEVYGSEAHDVRPAPKTMNAQPSRKRILDELKEAYDG
jgi:hypothetical protein